VFLGRERAAKELRVRKLKGQSGDEETRFAWDVHAGPPITDL
jgi:hypothetical protein